MVINIYGPYVDRILLWESVGEANMLRNPFTIVGGDLNFSLSLREVWGPHPREDRQRLFFSSFLRETKINQP
jgi:hypothetical protein